MQSYLRTNMMSLCFSGCSITWGDELTDRVNERYSTLVSKHYGCEGVNLSQCGISNDCIVRNSINYLQNNKADIVVIQYTVTSRLEYYVENGDLVLFNAKIDHGVNTIDPHKKVDIAKLSGRLTLNFSVASFYK